MTDTLKLWRYRTDIEKGALLLAHYEGGVIECLCGSSGWLRTDDPIWNPSLAYRIKPKAPKVETFSIKAHVWRASNVSLTASWGHQTEDRGIANITHTYTITDGIVTSCDTIIHKNGEADQ